jgi:hypothetical protein
MTDRRTASRDDASNAKKDSDNWVSGEEPMTGAQRSYLHTLAEEAGEDVPDGLTKAEASKRIDALRARTGKDSDKGRTPAGKNDSR